MWTVYVFVFLFKLSPCLFQIYELRVMETKPDKAVSIIECDMNVRPTFCINETPMNNSAVSFKLKCVFS